jgi:hypothetical protein
MFKFLRILVGLDVVVSLALSQSTPAASSTPANSTPILLELFTSEGCSSCPPADRLLAALDHDQPVSGAKLIVLSEHVDYWDRLGWKDPFSSSGASRRQEVYASHLGNADIFTPQLVIDGSSQVVGNNWSAVQAAIQKSLPIVKLPISLSAERQGANVSARVAIPHTTMLPGAPKHAEVYLVLAAERAHSQIARGENAGRSIDHVAVAGPFHSLGKLVLSQPWSKDINLPADHLPAGPLRVVAFVQDPSAKRIIGSAEARVE